MFRLFTLTTLLTALFVGQANAEDVKPGQLTVTGTGSVTAEPDEGYISVGVLTKEATAREALVANTEKMETLFKTLHEFGIEKKDFRTAQFNLQQAYKTVRVDNTNQSVPDGFLVNNQLQVTVCKLDTFGKVLDALIMGGANQVHSISFGSSEAKAKTDEARVAAVKDALEKAKLILEPLNLTIVRVASVSTHEHQPSVPMYNRMDMAEAKSGEVPLSGGSLTFSAQVNIVFDVTANTGPVEGADPRLQPE